MPKRMESEKTRISNLRLEMRDRPSLYHPPFKLKENNQNKLLL